MAGVKLGYNNQIDSADISLTVSAYPYLSALFLQSLIRKNVFKCSASQEIKGTFTVNAAIGLVHLWLCDLLGSYAIYLYSGVDQTGTLLYSATGLTDLTHWLPDNVTARSFKLVLSSSGVFNLSRVFIGTAATLEAEISLGAAVTYNDETDQRRTKGGSVHLVTGATFRSIEFDLDFLSQTDRTHLRNIYAQDGRSADIFISGLPDDALGLRNDFEMLCVIKNQPGYSVPYAMLAQSKLTLEEC